MDPLSSNPRQRLLWLLLPAAAILLIISLQAHHFHERAYRQDEAWVVNAALERISRMGLVDYVSLSLREFAAENLIQDLWVYAFGHIEPVARWLSTLMTALALAFFYRLGADLFDRHSACAAALLLGSYSIFAFFTGEARPYAGLMIGAIGFPWALLRFIRMPLPRRGLICLLLGVVPMFLHPFMLDVFAAQLICVLAFVRWDRRLYRRGLVMWLALGIIVLWRAWINFSSRSGSIKYNISSDWDGIAQLVDQFRFDPEPLGLFLLAFAAVIFCGKLWRGFKHQNMPRDPIMRFAIGWREGWLFLSLLIMLALPLLVNAFTPSLTPRNLLIIAPFLTLILVVGWRELPKPAQLLALLLFVAPFAAGFRSHISNAGYWEMVDFVDRHYDRERDRLVVIAAQAWEWIAIQYYLERRTEPALKGEDIFYVSWQRGDKDGFLPKPLDPLRFARGFDAGDRERLGAFLGQRERLFVIIAQRYEGAENMLEALDADYSLRSSISFPGETYYLPLEIREYRRHPAGSQALWRYGEAFDLLDWRLPGGNDVMPCQTIRLETWWRARGDASPLASSTVVIADENGQGIVNSDDVPGGLFPTSIWQAGRPYFDERELTLPCAIPAGEYPLLLGMYELGAGAVENLPIFTAAGEPTPRRLEYLTTLAVSP